MKRVVVGIDEVGRGPLAGPVTVSAFAVLSLSDIIAGAPAPLRDCKQLTHDQREAWHTYLVECSKKGWCKFSIASSSHTHIDKHGLTKSISSAIAKSLKTLDCNPDTTEIFLDGGLSAPDMFRYQTTIIRGDGAVPAIALASIVAKVHRDRHMRRMAKKYPQYGFDSHVGYATKNHRDAIKRHGASPIHRVRFLSRVLTGTSNSGAK